MDICLATVNRHMCTCPGDPESAYASVPQYTSEVLRQRTKTWGAHLVSNMLNRNKKPSLNNKNLFSSCDWGLYMVYPHKSAESRAPVPEHVS